MYMFQFPCSSNILKILRKKTRQKKKKLMKKLQVKKFECLIRLDEKLYYRKKNVFVRNTSDVRF